MSLYLENNIKIIPNVDWLNFHHTNKEIITIIKLYKLDFVDGLQLLDNYNIKN